MELCQAVSCRREEAIKREVKTVSLTRDLSPSRSNWKSEGPPPVNVWVKWLHVFTLIKQISTPNLPLCVIDLFRNCHCMKLYITLSEFENEHWLTHMVLVCTPWYKIIRWCCCYITISKYILCKYNRGYFVMIWNYRNMHQCPAKEVSDLYGKNISKDIKAPKHNIMAVRKHVISNAQLHLLKT